MLYQRRKPRWPLSDFVELLWLYDGATPTHDRERLMPTGSMDIVINLMDDEIRVYANDDPASVRRFRGSVFVGPHSEYFVIDTAEQARVAGICFKPGGAFVVIRPPAVELQNSHVGLHDLWGRAASDIRERLLEARTPDDKFRAMEDCLLAQLARPLARHPAVEYALGEIQARPGAQTVSAITDRIGLSPRRFIQVFSEQVGYTPKLFCRVRRFQQVLHAIHGRRSVDWADVALSCGYFDQSHFIHDFRAFSGISPTSYLAGHSEHLNHVPMR
jgi:AraC-like DNA-binding protein